MNEEKVKEEVRAGEVAETVKNTEKLLAAATAGDTATVRTLLEEVEAGEFAGVAGDCLRAAVRNGHVETARILLDKDAATIDYESEENDGRPSILYLAVQSGSPEMVRLVVGADSSWACISGCNFGKTFRAALEMDKPEMVYSIVEGCSSSQDVAVLALKAALSCGKTTVALDMADKLTPARALELRKELRKQDGVDKDMLDKLKAKSKPITRAKCLKWGLGAACTLSVLGLGTFFSRGCMLEYGVKNNMPTMAGLALNLGASLEEGKNLELLNESIKKRNTEVVRLLLERCEFPQDASIAYNALTSKDPEILRLVLENGLNPNKNFISGLSLVDYLEPDAMYTVVKHSKPYYSLAASAILMDDNGLMDVLAEYKATLLPEEKSLLLYRSKSLEDIQTLERFGLSVADMQADPGAAVSAAVHRGDMQALRYVVEQKGVSVAGKCNELVSAAYCADVELIRYLVEKGADINTRNGSGATPLMIAVAGGNEPVVRYLLGLGADTTVGSFLETEYKDMLEFIDDCCENNDEAMRAIFSAPQQ